MIYLAISDYLYQLSSIRLQLEAGESKLLLFETFPLFFKIVPGRVIEELALLKIKSQMSYGVWGVNPNWDIYVF